MQAAGPVQSVTRRRLMMGASGAAALAGGLAPAACAPAPGRPPAAASGRVLFWQESSSELAMQLWNAMAASFKEAYPRIDLQFDRTPVPQGQSRDDKLFATLSSGDAWDVWQRDIPPSYQQPLVDRKAVLALDEYYATMPNLKRVFTWARNRSKLFGKTWGVPHEVEFIPIFYNKGAFARAGVKETPKTWDQFLTLNRTFKAAGIQPMNIAKGRTNPGHNFSIYLMGLIGKDGFEDLLYRDKRWDGHEGVIRAAQTLVDFQKQGFIPQDCMTGDYNVGVDFPNGKVAMWGNGTWAVAGYEQNKRNIQGFDYHFFVPPPQDPRVRPTLAGGLGGGFSIWSETRNREAAVTFVDFLMSPTAQKHWIEILFQVAPVPFKPEDYKVPEAMVGALKTIASPQEMGYNVSVVVPAKFVDVYWDGLVDILNGKLTPREWTARLQQEWDVAKREGRTPKP
jgi:raffinose/stachyose/melibiose transport system substrate-binding protein